MDFGDGWGTRCDSLPFSELPRDLGSPCNANSISFVYKYLRAARSLFLQSWSGSSRGRIAETHVTKATSEMTTVFAKCLRSVVPCLEVRFVGVGTGRDLGVHGRT